MVLNPSALKAPALLHDLQMAALLHPRSSFDSTTQWYTTVTGKFKAAGQEHHRKLEMIKDMRLEALSTHLKTLEDLLARDPSHPTAQSSIKELKAEIHKEKIKIYDHERIHSAAKYFKEGERCTKYFSSFVKKRQVQNTIPALRRLDGTTASSTKDILEYATDFYEALYSQVNTDDAARDKLLSKLTARVDPQMAIALDSPISEKEVMAAVSQNPTSRAPGPDGLPAELWKALTGLIPDLLPSSTSGTALASPRKSSSEWCLSCSRKGTLSTSRITAPSLSSIPLPRS